jgi:hypothetical protein
LTNAVMSRDVPGGAEGGQRVLRDETDVNSGFLPVGACCCTARGKSSRAEHLRLDPAADVTA